MPKFTIITGASKGIGNALALKYKAEGYKVISIARTTANNLLTDEQIICDLTNISNTQKTFIDILTKIKLKKPTEVLLINNAGTLGQINRLQNIEPNNIENSIKLNVTIPTVLSSLFIKEFEQLNITKNIINISSGAAVSPYYGWSVYCASKAGIDMLTKVIATEQKSAQYPTRVLSLYPGVVDTGMQTLIRTKNKTQFENIDRFIELKEKGLLSSPEEAANSIYTLYANPKVISGSVIDVRNA
jgi:benzil reductase ((S)-benzoin forming)